MSEFSIRQITVMRNLASDYHKGNISLNTFIQQIEGVCDVLGKDTWKDAIFPIVLDLEQINAVALSTQTGMTESNKADVDNLLIKFEVLLSSFEGDA